MQNTQKFSNNLETYIVIHIFSIKHHKYTIFFFFFFFLAVHSIPGGESIFSAIGPIVPLGRHSDFSAVAVYSGRLFFIDSA